MISRLARIAGITGAFVMVSFVPAYAQDDAFRKGISARNDKKWEAVVSLMRDAIRIDTNESDRKVGRFSLIGGGDQYLPHFYLAEALFMRSDCPGGLAAMDESDRQGVARRDARNAKLMQQKASECEAKGFLVGQKFTKEVQDAEAVVGQATQEAQRFAEYAGTHGDLWTPEERGRTAAFDAQVKVATERLAIGQKSRRTIDLTEARNAADTAVRGYRSAREVLEKVVTVATAFASRIKTIESDLQNVERAGRELAAAVSSAPVKITVPETVAAATRQAETFITNAHGRLTAATKSQAEDDLNEATRLVQSAGTAYGQARTQLDLHIGTAVNLELTTLQGTAQQAFAAADARAQVINGAVTTTPPSADVARDFARAQRTLATTRQRFDQAVRQRDLTTARTAAQAAGPIALQLEQIAALLGVSGPSVPEALLTAAQALFEGRYRDVLSRLSSDVAGGLPMPLRIHGHLVRAAALFALYEYSGAADQQLRAQARTEADASRALDAAFQPNPAAFSPRFISFFNGTASQ